MEYQKNINLLEYAANQLSQFKTKNWVETNDNGRRVHNTNNQCQFKTTMLISSLYDYRYAYILVKGADNYSKTLGRLWQYCLNHLNLN